MKGKKKCCAYVLQLLESLSTKSVADVEKVVRAGVEVNDCIRTHGLTTVRSSVDLKLDAKVIDFGAVDERTDDGCSVKRSLERHGPVVETLQLRHGIGSCELGRKTVELRLESEECGVSS